MSLQSDALEALVFNADTDTAIQHVADILYDIMLPWVSSFVIVALVWKHVAEYLKTYTFKIELKETVTILFLFFLFMNFNMVFGSLSRVIDVFNVKAAKELDDKTPNLIKIQFMKICNKPEYGLSQSQLDGISVAYKGSDPVSMTKNLDLLQAEIHVAAEKAGKDPAVLDEKDFWDQVIHFLGHLPNIIMSGVFSIFSSLIRLGAVYIVNALDKVFYVFGILAVAFSILPFARDKLAGWFGTWLTIKFTILTISVIDSVIFVMMLKEYAPTTADSLANEAQLLTIHIVTIVMYVMLFWTTSKFIGSGDAAKVLDSAKNIGMALATAGAGMAMKNSMASTGDKMGGFADALKQSQQGGGDKDSGISGK
jgi:hypothetical protein